MLKYNNCVRSILINRNILTAESSKKNCTTEAYVWIIADIEDHKLSLQFQNYSLSYYLELDII